MVDLADHGTPIGAPRSIGSSSPADLLDLDPALAAYVAELVETAARDGHRSGLELGRAEANARLGALEQAMTRTVDAVRTLTSGHRDEFTDDVVELAESIATVVIDRTPHDGGRQLLERLRAELDDHRDVPVEIAVHPDDLAIVAAAVASDQVTVEMDPTLQPGDMVVSTEWSSVERTRTAAWELVRSAISADQ